MTHGFDLTPADHALLRGPVPEAALRWVASVAGGPVEGVPVALEGGTSAAVHALRAGGRDLVLRRFVRADWLAVEPDLAEHEARALAIAAALPFATPRLVAHDPDGDAAGGAPAVLMTRVPGTTDLRPHDLDAYTRALAELLPPLRAIPVAPGALPPYAPYPLETDRPPSWLTAAEWERAVAALADPPRGRPAHLVHRDFHPGNVLWLDGAVSGVVDWVNAAVGPAGADVGHCRMDLTDRFGRAAADRFTAHHHALTGHEPHPWDDLAAALGAFSLARLEAKNDEGRALVERALTELG